MAGLRWWGAPDWAYGLQQTMQSVLTTVQIVYRRQENVLTAIDDANARLDVLDQVVHQAIITLDELARLAKANPTGVPAEQVLALTARVDKDIADLQAGVAAGKPAS